VTALRVCGAVLAAALGASLGSFLAVVVERVPKGESIGGRSVCVCGTPIRARDNLPIIGYLRCGGRARCCGAPIPLWYLGAEVAGAAIALGVYLILT
jgi:leader peptidase (prepilin peptidase)/N-methyltransferase